MACKVDQIMEPLMREPSSLCDANVASLNKRFNLKANVSEVDVEDDETSSSCLLNLVSKTI